MTGGSLLDGDGRGKPLDGIHIGLPQTFQELARVRRQRRHIATLAFSIEGVKSKRGLAGTRKAGEDDQLIARYIRIDIFEIMLACAA
jgi:hypothetical protein